MGYIKLNNITINILFFTLIFLFFSGCMQSNTDTQGVPAGRKWTIMIYMAADNDLEAAAIADFNELEAVALNGTPITILVLLDRNPGYDKTNGDWSDTRVFEIKTDPKGLTPTIISPRINCPELGLTVNTETDLNTADPLVLSSFIDFAKREYKADRYALFIWGHGTGWRGGVQNNVLPMPYKAIAIDDTRNQYMSLPSFGKAVAGKGLSLIAFDTCYAALLEVVYQIKNDAELFVGSVGAIPSTGWDYTTLFTDFLKKPNLSVDNLGDSIQNQFSMQYSGLDYATISQIKLSQVDNLFTSFNNFAGTVATAITTAGVRTIVLKKILDDVESYYFTTFPSDLFIDIYDFSNKIAAIRTSITTDPSWQNTILSTASTLDAALTSAVKSSWAKNGTTNKLGIYVIPLQNVGVPDSSHDLAYIRNSMHMDKSAFVNNSQNWVPNITPQSNSLLDKLFYWTY